MREPSRARRVGPEFLLLALARADCSLAAITLDSMGVDRPRLVFDLLKRVATDETRHAQEGSIDSCIRRADDLARASHHSLIGTQHLLLCVDERGRNLRLVEAHSDEIVRMPSAKALTFGRVNAELSSLLS